MTNLPTLADRIEAATGPDRELDELIAAFAANAVREVQADGRTAYHSLDGSRWVSVHSPAFTSSIDAALTLVPEGWALGLLGEVEGRRWSCTIHRRDRQAGSVGGRDGGTANPALAIAAAALRSRTLTEGR